MAMIIFNRRYKNRLAMVVPAAKAKEIQDFLDNPPDDLTDEQSDFLLAIKQIYPGTRRLPQEPDSSHLTHQGIQQGVSQQLPTGDR